MALKLDRTTEIKVKASITIPVEVEFSLLDLEFAQVPGIEELYNDDMDFSATSMEVLEWLKNNTDVLKEQAREFILDDKDSYIEISDNALDNAEITVPSLKMKL